MIKTLYICDICNQEMNPDEIYGLIPACIPFDQDPPAEVVKILGNRHICIGCLKKLFQEPEEKPAEKPKRKYHKRDEVAALPQEEMDRICGRKKRWYMTKADEERIRELYCSGMEIEQISDEIQVGMAPISRFVTESGLAEERYAKHPAV